MDALVEKSQIGSVSQPLDRMNLLFSSLLSLSINLPEQPERFQQYKQVLLALERELHVRIIKDNADVELLKNIKTNLANVESKLKVGWTPADANDRKTLSDILFYLNSFEIFLREIADKYDLQLPNSVVDARKKRFYP